MESKVFLVDDDADDIELMQEALRQSDYKGHIGTAKNGQVLMDKLRTNESLPDLILLDLNMPLKNGFEVLDELKEDQTLRNIPVIVVTASSSEIDRLKCLSMGCKLFVRKPSSMADYTSLINSALSFM